MRGARAICAALALAFAHTAARAQSVPPGGEGPLADLLAPVPGKSICFARRYDRAHLEAHPVQKVTAMTLRLRYHRHEPDGTYPQGQRNYYATLSVRLRDGGKALAAELECGPRGASIVCAVDCDGGGFSLARQGTGSVLVDLTRLGRLRLGEGCDGEGVELTPGRDDRRFRLDEAARCDASGD